MLNGPLARDSSTLVIDGSTIDADTVGAGWLIVVGTGSTAEWMRITGGDLTTGITVDRAILDTTPQVHADEARVWVMPPECILQDATQHTDADTVDYKLLTRTGGGILAITGAGATSVTMASRQARPYPPGNIAINTESWPVLIEGALSVAWAHRDRTAFVIATQSATDIGPEAGTTYNAYAYDDGDSTLLDSATLIAGTTWAPAITINCRLRIEIEASRGALVSWQRQVRLFDYVATDTLTTETPDALSSETGDALTTET